PYTPSAGLTATRLSSIDCRIPLTSPSAVPVICTLPALSQTRGRTTKASFFLNCGAFGVSVPAAIGGPVSRRDIGPAVSGTTTTITTHMATSFDIAISSVRLTAASTYNFTTSTPALLANGARRRHRARVFDRASRRPAAARTLRSVRTRAPDRTRRHVTADA